MSFRLFVAFCIQVVLPFHAHSGAYLLAQLLPNFLEPALNLLLVVELHQLPAGELPHVVAIFGPHSAVTFALLNALHDFLLQPVNSHFVDDPRIRVVVYLHQQPVERLLVVQVLS